MFNYRTCTVHQRTMHMMVAPGSVSRKSSRYCTLVSLLCCVLSLCCLPQAALELGNQPEMKGKTICVIIPSFGERSVLFRSYYIFFCVRDVSLGNRSLLQSCRKILTHHRSSWYLRFFTRCIRYLSTALFNNVLEEAKAQKAEEV